MDLFELNIVGDVPDDLDIQPIVRVVRVINETELDWLVPGVINLKLVDDKAIQALNKTYSGNNYATDVLSFSYVEDKDWSPEERAVRSHVGSNLGLQELEELGDMVVSVETAQRQAQKAGIDFKDEIATLALHGILHIFGLDHADSAQQLVMDQYQVDILARAKVKYRDFKWE